ncbi:MAG: alpha/beta fold hydrolase [Anaerolineae bacterium]
MDKTIDTRFGSLYAHVQGQGPAILLLHGYHPDNDWQIWENNVQALADAGFCVYALDMVGYGRSEGQRLDHGQQAQALLDVMAAEGIESATVGGVSWGGLIALELALNAPEKVERLILVDSAGAGLVDEERLETLAHPTLVVWGEDDAVLPLANAAWFGAAIPRARVETIPDVTAGEGVPPWGGHHPMRFKPEAFNRIVLDFMAGT